MRRNNSLIETVVLLNKYRIVNKPRNLCSIYYILNVRLVNQWQLEKGLMHKLLCWIVAWKIKMSMTWTHWVVPTYNFITHLMNIRLQNRAVWLRTGLLNNINIANLSCCSQKYLWIIDNNNEISKLHNIKLFTRWTKRYKASMIYDMT